MTQATSGGRPPGPLLGTSGAPEHGERSAGEPVPGGVMPRAWNRAPGPQSPAGYEPLLAVSL